MSLVNELPCNFIEICKPCSQVSPDKRRVICNTTRNLIHDVADRVVPVSVRREDLERSLGEVCSRYINLIPSPSLATGIEGRLLLSGIVVS